MCSFERKEKLFTNAQLPDLAYKSLQSYTQLGMELPTATADRGIALNAVISCTRDTNPAQRNRPNSPNIHKLQVNETAKGL